jgi:hypothetical protein
MIVMKISRLWVCATITTVLLQGCVVYDLMTEFQATKDAEQNLKSRNLKVESLSCKSLGGGAYAVCTFKLDSQQLQKLVNGSKLEHVYTSRSMDDLIALGEKAFKDPKLAQEIEYARRLRSIEHESCWAKLRTETSTKIDLYGVYDSSTGFIESELFHAKSIEKGCITIDYPMPG